MVSKLMLKLDFSQRAAIPVILKFDLLRSPKLRVACCKSIHGKDCLVSSCQLVGDCKFLKLRQKKVEWEILLALFGEILSGSTSLVSDLQHLTELSKSTINRHLKKLVSGQALAILSDPKDHRRRIVTLSPVIEAVLVAFVNIIANEFKDLIELYDKRERSKALDALRVGQLELAEKSILLQATLDAIDQGFAVWDSEHRLVAWNEKCENFWYHPKDLHVGMMMDQLLRHLAEQGAFGAGEKDQLARHQLQHILASGPNSEEQIALNDGRQLDLHRFPMPGGGHATVYSDVTEHKRLEQSLRAARDGLEKKVRDRTLSLRKEITQRKKIESELRMIAETVSGKVGGTYFNTLLAHLAKATGADYAFIGKRAGSAVKMIQSVAVHAMGKVGEQFEYVLAGTPCENVLAGTPCENVLDDQPCFYNDGIQARFPEDTLLVEMDIKSYAGIPLSDVFGHPVGILVVLAKRPMQWAEQTLSLLKIFASRVAVELQRKETEQVLRDSEARLVNAQRIARLGNWSWNVNKGTLWWSDEIYRIFDVDADRFEPTYEAFLDLVHADDRRNVAHCVDKALQDARPYDIKHRIMLANGQVKHVHQIAEVSFDDKGNPLRMNGTVQDITERQQVEGALAASQQLMVDLVETTLEGFWMIDADGITTDVNPAMCNILGRRREDIVGLSIFNFVDDENAKIFHRQIEKRKSGLKGIYEISLQQPDGTNVPCINSATPVYNSVGEKTGSVGLWHDISERKLMENQRQKAHDKLELRVTERTQELTDEINERRTIEAELLDRTELLQLLYKVTAIANEANDINAAMKSCLKEICIYTTWPVGHVYAASPSDPNILIPTDIWHMDNPQRFSVFHDITMNTIFEKGTGMVGRVMASGKLEWIENLQENPGFIRARTDLDIVVNVGFSFPIKVRNNVVAVMEFFSALEQQADQSLLQAIEHIGTQLGRLHERAEAEKTLLVAKEEAETANKAKSTFLSSMSHELRTPLNAIIGFSTMTKDEILGPLGNVKYREYQDDIHHSGLLLLKIINDVLDVSTIEAGALELHEEDVTLANVIEHSLNLIKPRAITGRVRVSSSLDPQTQQIYGDKRRVEQILLNLLSNAVKFTREGGSVSVSVRLNDDGSLSIAVSDTGVGMNEQEVGIALRRFEQVDSGLERKHEGTGLGLPLTRELMELHGGFLDINSMRGSGTIVTVTFPKERVRKGA